VQSRAIFQIESIESTSVPAPFALRSPFSQLVNSESLARFEYRNEHGTFAVVSMATDFYAGSEVTGLIDFRESNSDNAGLCIGVTIRLIRTEIYLATGATESTTLSEINLNTPSVQFSCVRRFAIFLPFQTTADFATDIFSVHYSIECLFFVKRTDEQYKLLISIHVFPPQITLLNPRNPISAS
jgi:hypothetical protein